MSSTPKENLEDWHSSSEYQSGVPGLTIYKFCELTDLLLERPNLNSSHLFRADILRDSNAKLKTISEKEKEKQDKRQCESPIYNEQDTTAPKDDTTETEINSKRTNVTSSDLSQYHMSAPGFSGFMLHRTVIRNLIPRKPQVDSPMVQSCFIYTSSQGDLNSNASMLVIYIPHANAEADIPWYHPKVKSLAYQYIGYEDGGMLSIHYQLFPDSEDTGSDRLHRTILSLLHTFIRLSKLESNTVDPIEVANTPVWSRPMNPAALKDTILAQHVVQNTYTRLKQTYAADLISRWVEKTEPSKHVFEDLSIAAFLIELWRSMYQDQVFPGFVDIACGNGVLVYVLTREGFSGKGFDARKRKTWDILGIDDHLEEALCIPRPFLDILTPEKRAAISSNIQINDGLFDCGTFIVSNHADELTPWTPLLAALSCFGNPLPFLAIPCCSHALNGARHRYNLKDIDTSQDDGGLSTAVNDNENDQPAVGDLKKMRSDKAQAQSRNDDKSAYACLTKKTVALAEELGMQIELTLMRIPSTRNIGIVGNRHLASDGRDTERNLQLSKLLERECARSGGLSAAAETWIERAEKLIKGPGRGKINLGGEMHT